MSNKENIGRNKPKAYIPPNAQINLDKRVMPPPSVEYQDVEVIFDIDAVKNVTKGKYGKREE